MSKMFLTKGPFPRGSGLPRVEVNCSVCDTTVVLRKEPKGKWFCPVCEESKSLDNEAHVQRYS